MKRKKYRIKSKFRFTVFIAVLVVSAAFVSGTLLGFNDASSLSEKSAEPAYITVEVCAGDTLWQLADEYGPKSADRRQVVYEICKVNDVETGTIYPGQSLLIPEEI